MRFLSLIALLTSVISTYAQKSKVELIIEPSHVEVGESIRITVKSNVEGVPEVDNIPGSFIQDYSINEAHQDIIDYNTGEVTTIHYYSYSGIITKAGKYEIGPAYVKNMSKVYPSNKVEVTIDPKSNISSNGQITNKQLNDPAFGVISSSKTEIFEGEPVIFSAKVYSHYDPSHISGYMAYTVPGAVIKYPLGNSSNIKVNRERIKGIDLFAFTYDKNVVFPSGVGKVVIEPYQLNLHQGYQSFPINSGSLSIKIKPLPINSPQSFIGAVGNFDVNSSIDSSSITQGNVFTYIVKINGSGNLMNIKEPRLNLPKGFIIYGDPEKEEDFNVGINGAEGEVTFNYHIQVLTFGNFDLPAVEVSYFDPKKEKYITISGLPEKIEVKRDPSIKDVASTKKSTNEITPKSEKNEDDSADGSSGALTWKNVAFVVIPGIGILAALFFVFMRRRKEENKENTPPALSPILNHKKQITESYSSAKTVIGSDDNTFYSSVQQCLNYTFLDLMKKQEGSLSISAITDWLRETNKTEHIERVEQIFEVVQASKYGMGSDNSEKQQILAQLELLLKAFAYL